MKKTRLLFLCLLMSLLLSACHLHIDADPWPASPGYEAATQPVTQTATPVPVESPSPLPPADLSDGDDAPEVTDVTVPPAEPEVTLTPVVTAVPDVTDSTTVTQVQEPESMETPTPVPNLQEVEPGFNG